MRKKGGKRGLTRLEALVLAGLYLLLTALVPALFAMPRARASRVLCGANLARIGKTMFVYADDYDGALARAGGPTTTWGPLCNWLAPDRYGAYGLNRTGGSGGQATLSSCLYLLVKYYRAPPRLFICKGDIGTSEFKLSNLPAGTVPPGTQLSDLWNFGPAPVAMTNACSYAYHAPFGSLALTTARDPNLAVAADRNPWLNSPSADAKPYPGTGAALFRPDIEPYYGSSAQGRNGNAITHEGDGQNVLFLDGRVVFETRAYCGVRRDNIYTMGDRGGGALMGSPAVSSSQPQHADDSLLLHDDATCPCVCGPRPAGTGR
jgi:hypothetical protein